MTDMVYRVADISVLVNMLLGSTQSETQVKLALVACEGHLVLMRHTPDSLL